MLSQIWCRDKKEDAGNTLFSSLYDKQTGDCDHNIALAGLQELREIAWQKAIKYRFDPVLGRAHEEYLDFLNGLIAECV